MATKKLKTVQEWQHLLEQILLDIRRQFIKLGETLYHAQNELSVQDYKKVVSYVEQYSLKDADIKSAIAAYLHEHPDLGTEDDQRIDPALVFAGAKNSKILFMDKQDQQRLLSGEKFQVIMPNGKPDKPKAWKEMNEVQRNTLIGKGGKILSVGAQLDNLRGKDKAALYPLGSIEGEKNRLVFSSRNGSTHLQVSYAEFARMLLAAECWETLTTAVEEVKQESGGMDRVKAVHG